MNELLMRLRHRLAYLERVAYWRGRVSRADLVETYDLSGVQASADLQKYMELNPGALEYDLRRKRYFWVEGSPLLFQKADFERAVGEFLNDGEEGSVLGFGGVLRLEYPRREVAAGVLLEMFRAVVNGARLRVRYGSVHSGKVAERRLAPSGFGHDGFRWHVRAFCFKNGEYRDFVLGRVREVLEVEERGRKDPPLPRDDAWHETVELRMRLNPALPKEVSGILGEDFAVDGKGVLRWTVRRALAHYAEHYLKSLAHPLDGKAKRMIPWFVEKARLRSE